LPGRQKSDQFAPVIARFSRTKPKNSLRANSDFMSRFKLIWVVQSPAKKYIASLPPSIGSFFAHPVPQEGRYANVTKRWNGWRWTQQFARRAD
jgi:hypothetical protein